MAEVDPAREAQLAEDCGRKLRALREQKRLTQEQLAEAAGVSVSYVSMLERGERLAQVPVLDALARALGDQVGNLFGCAEAS